MYMYIYTCVHIYTCVLYTFTYMYSCLHIFTCIHLFISLDICMYNHTCLKFVDDDFKYMNVGIYANYILVYTRTFVYTFSIIPSMHS